MENINENVSGLGNHISLHNKVFGTALYKIRTSKRLDHFNCHLNLHLWNENSLNKTENFPISSSKFSTCIKQIKLFNNNRGNLVHVLD